MSASDLRVLQRVAFDSSRALIVVTAARDTEQVIVSVRDNGVGLGADVVDRVFEPFVQGRQSLDRSQGGLGLGLAIVRSIVTMHQGSVDARSDGPGRGSEFLVHLPLTTGVAAPEAMESIAVSHPMPAQHDVRVLIVDDNVDAAQTLARVLCMHGIQVDVGHDGPEAVRVARECKPHVALLDLGRPAMDGYEVARRLRESSETADTTLVAVTGYGEECDRQRTREAGFTAHFVKPVDIDDVLRVIREAENVLHERKSSVPGQVELTRR